jgi:hypothetical protein
MEKDANRRHRNRILSHCSDHAAFGSDGSLSVERDDGG